MGDLGSIFALSLLAMFTPTLLAAVTVMMLLPNPKKLMLGYLLGALMTSISVGLLIVFSLNDSAAVETGKQSLGPGEDIVLGLLLVVISWVLGSGKDARLQARRQRRKEEKEASGEAKESWPERMLGRGSARVTFAVGAVLTLPGVSYLTALDRMAKLDIGTAETVALVVAFCLIQMTLIEVPLLGYAFAPERTKERVTAFRDWLGRNGRRVAIRGAAVLGALLILRGVIEIIVG
jgi:Sap, sulfolipid-1-addressing protein